MITVTAQPFDPAEALRSFQTSASGAGAIVSFTGLVRDHSASGNVTTLHLQAYEPLTTNGITAAADEAQTRWPLTALTIIHRTGDMGPADPIVFVATASAHRRAAFRDAADLPCLARGREAHISHRRA